MNSGRPASTADEARVPAVRFALALTVALVPFAWLVRHFNWVCDDSYISFRFAKHFAAGEGLRYNLGSAPPVEGYSNFLWVLIAAVFEHLGLEVTVWMRVLSIACGAALVAAVMRFAQRALRLTTLETLATGLFFGTLPALGIWSTSGLASMPTCLFGFLVFERLLGDPERPRGVQAAVCAVLLALLRADGFVFVSLVLGIAGVTWLGTRRKSLLSAALLVGGALALAVGLHAAWRYGYYGDAVPHTARVKAGFSAMRLERGWNYLVTNLLTALSVPLVLACALLPRARPERLLALQAGAFCLATAAYAVYPGGDFMPLGRFLLPAMPFVALLFAGALRGTCRGKPPALGAATGGLVALSLLPSFDHHVVPEPLRERFNFRWGEPEYRSEYGRWVTMARNAELWARVGRALALVARPGESLVESRIGAIGYYSGLTIHDGFGLVNNELEELDVEPRRTTPGHDRKVPVETWVRYSPTYSQPAIKSRKEAEAQRQEFERTGRGYFVPWPGPVELELHELPESPDFRRGTFLTLYRYLPARRP